MSRPTGLITFVLTDVEGSTPLWDKHPEAMPAVIERHDAVIRAVVRDHGGVTVQEQGEGDSTLSAFSRPGDAVRAALAMQDAIAGERWPAGVSLRVRAGIHTGEAQQRDGRYFGAALNRAARVRGLASGAQILVSQATTLLVRDALPAGVELRDAGRHELRGLSRDEQVYQLLPAGAPRGPATGSPTARLPAPLTSFVGRDAERAEVVGALDASRLVTIVGPGGSGKTRLAIEVARAALERDRRFGAAWMAELAPVTGDAVLLAVAGAVGASAAVEVGDEGALERIAAAVAGRTGLLVLDNCEHVLDAAAGVAADLLATATDLTVLATSQAPLGIHGEVVVGLAPLAPPDARALFMARAKSRHAGFEADDGVAGTIDQICERLDFLPLAIELAAAHIRTLPPSDLLDRIERDPLGLLTKGSRHAVDRQRTLEGAIAWSFGLLAPEEQGVLARLSVFRGGFTLVAAEAVVAGGDLGADGVVDVIDRLVDRSFLVARPGKSGTRYHLLETVRLFAERRLRETSQATPVAAPRPEPAPGATAAGVVTLRREGEVWAVASPNGVAHVKDSKGVRYLAQLLSRPGNEIHALDLAGGAAVQSASAQAVLDGTARAQYKQRIVDLAEDLEEARSSSDLARVERLEAEVDALTDELAKATGLGGRDRAMTDSAERARVSVTKAVRQAIERIEAVDPTAGGHLRATVRTGAFCAYEPPVGAVKPVPGKV